MKTVEIAKITILPNRQRRQFDPAKMHEFSDGISKRGLLHPIILREENGTLILVAGERRLRAVTDLSDLGELIKHDGEVVPFGHIPYTLLTDLDRYDAEEAELEENIHRVDLTWQERAAAHERLANLRTGQAMLRGEALPTVAAIALEVRGSAEGSFHDTTRKELIVAKHLDKPEVQAAKSVDEAFKILKKQEQTEKHRALGVQVGTTFTADMHQVLNTDALEHLKGYMSDSFDCILTDPPYGMGADEFGDSGGLAAGAHAYRDDWTHAENCYVAAAVEGFRICKPRAHAYIFCDIGRFELVKAIFEAAGWEVFRTPLLWYKRHGSRAPWPEYGPQRKYESLLYAVKGKRPALRMAADVLDHPADTNLGHAAQKPVALYRDLLSRTCLPGDSVIDPFCGTGPIFPAAHELRVKATGIERDTASYGIAVKRIADLRAQLEIDLAVKG